MKKLLTIAALASAAAASAVEIEVGTVGVTKITPTGRDTVVVTSYDELAGASSMPVSNIVKTANLPEYTKLYVLKASSEYEGYTLRFVSGDSGPKHWVRDLNYTVNANGTLAGGTSSSVTSIPTLTVGKGFWLSFPEAPAADQYIYAYGKPPANTNVLVTARSTVLVGNPKQTAATPDPDGAAKGDKILVFDGSSKWPTTYISNGSKWRNSSTRVEGLPSINAGTGFWYLSGGSSNVTIKW